MVNKGGCVLAILGCAVAVFTVALGLLGLIGVGCQENYDEIPGWLVLAIGGPLVGFIVFIVGVVRFVKENSVPEGPSQLPPSQSVP